MRIEIRNLVNRLWSAHTGVSDLRVRLAKMPSRASQVGSIQTGGDSEPLCLMRGDVLV